MRQCGVAKGERREAEGRAVVRCMWLHSVGTCGSESVVRTFHIDDGPVGHLLAVGLLPALLALPVGLVVSHNDHRQAPVTLEFLQLAPLGRQIYVRLYNRGRPPQAQRFRLAISKSRQVSPIAQDRRVRAVRRL